MALRAHETKAVAGSVVSPATTLANLQNYGSDVILMTSTENIRCTFDGITAPVVGAGSEVGLLLGPTGSVQALILTPEEFVNLKMLDVSTDARVQFEFLSGDRHRIS
jgi:hypothetical protein